MHLLVGGADGFLGEFLTVQAILGRGQVLADRLYGDGAADFAAVLPAHAIRQNGGAQRELDEKGVLVVRALTAGMSGAVGMHHGMASETAPGRSRTQIESRL